MLNMDMVGMLDRGRHTYSFASGASSVDIDPILKSLSSRYRFGERITSQSSGGSDHASFYNKEVPVAFLHTGGHPHYHTPSDTPDKIDFEGLAQVAKFATELIVAVDQSENPPRFSYSTFKPLPYRHDHSHPETPFPSERPGIDNWKLPERPRYDRDD